MNETHATGPRSSRPDGRGILGGSTMPKVDAAVKNAIREKFAWPGGYPLFLITTDGGAVCVDCGRKEFKQIAYAVRHSLNNGWNAAAVDVNWEDPDLYCDHCNQQIESAYAP